MADHGGNRLDYVQGLRGAAMLVIVVYHCDLPPSGGFVALDIFFVISGYVIAGMLLREKRATGRISLVDFYHRRVRRLLPLLAVTVVATVLLSAVLESPLTSQRVTGKVGAFASVSLANVALYRSGTGYFESGAENIPLRHTWSLSVEEQFYLFFPLFVALLLWGNRRRLWAVVAGTSVVSALSFAALALTAVGMFPLIGNQQSFAYYSPVTRLWEMGLGVGLAVWHLTRPPLGVRTARWVGAIGTLGVLAALVLFTSELEASTPALALPVVGTTMLLLACRTPGLLSGALSWAPLCWVGDRSYGWYLWHWPLIVFANDVWPDSSLVKLAATAVALGASAVTYPLVEQRFRYPRRDRSRPQQLRAGLRLAVVCVVVSVGASVALNRAAVLSWGSPEIRSMAAQVRPIPVNLGPKGCPMDAVIETGSAERCTVVDGTGAPIYLVGDSNAGQYAAGLVVAAEELDRPLVLLWRPGCSFSDVTVLRDANDGVAYDAAGCDEHIDLITQWLSTAPDATVVVGNGGEFIESPVVRMRDPVTGDVATTSGAKAALWERGLERALGALRDAGQRTILVRMLPHPGGPDENGTAASWSATSCGLLETVLVHDACAETASLGSETERQAAELEAQDAATQALGVEELDVRDVVCPDGTCRPRRGDDWVFRDSMHLTDTESRRLGQLWVDLLAQDPEDSQDSQDSG